MIISHKYKMVFMKAQKTGSSSVEAALYPYLGLDDVATGDQWGPGKNMDQIGTNNQHVGIPELIERGVFPEDYTIVSVRRNPWDREVSSFWFVAAALRKEEFNITKAAPIEEVKEKFNSYLEGIYINGNPVNHVYGQSDVYYFTPAGEPRCDIYLDFNNLDQEYQELCQQLTIPYEPLGRFNSHQRKQGLDYTHYYDKSMRDLVAAYWNRDIWFFQWQFGEDIGRKDYWTGLERPARAKLGR